MENPEFMELLYGRNFHILIPYTPPSDYGSGLDSFGDDVDLQMSDTVVYAASLDCTEYN